MVNVPGNVGVRPRLSSHHRHNAESLVSSAIFFENRRRPRSSRSGFVLLIVMIAMVLASALMIGALYRAATEADVARTGTMRRRALSLAESAAWSAMLGASAPTIRAAPTGLINSSSTTVGDATTSVTVEKVDTSNVWIVAVATVRQRATWARHRVGVSAFIPSDTSVVVIRPIPDRAWVELF